MKTPPKSKTRIPITVDPVLMMFMSKLCHGYELETVAGSVAGLLADVSLAAHLSRKNIHDIMETSITNASKAHKENREGDTIQ